MNPLLVSVMSEIENSILGMFYRLYIIYVIAKSATPNRSRG